MSSVPSTTDGSESSVAPLARANASPSRKSRLPCITRISVPLAARRRRKPATTALNGVSMSSSPIQYSNRSPRMKSACAPLASCSMNLKKRSFASGRSSLRCRSEMKSERKLLGGADARRLDDHRLLRHIAREGTARAGGQLGDLVHHVHAGHHLAEHRVAVAVAARVAPVEEGVVVDVDEELRGCRVRIRRARHGDGADVVLQSRLDRALRLVGDRTARLLLAEIVIEAAALDHETVNDAMEHRAVVMAVFHVLQEVLDGLRSLGGIKLEADGAEVRAQVDLRVGGEGTGRHYSRGRQRKEVT